VTEWFQFPIQPAVLPCLSARQYSGLLVYPILDIRLCGNDFELILMVKIETKHPAEGSFCSEFRVICNHCIFMAARSCKSLKFCEKLLWVFFLEKWPLTGTYSKLCLERFYRDTDWRCCAQILSKIWPTGNWWNCALFIWQKNFACLSNYCYCTDRAQNLLWPTPNNVLSVLQISS